MVFIKIPEINSTVSGRVMFDVPGLLQGQVHTYDEKMGVKYTNM